MKFTAEQISKKVDGNIEGNPNVELSILSKIEEAKVGSITFLSNPKYTPFIYSTNASITIVNESFIPEQNISTTLIRVKNAYDSFSQLLDYYEERIDIPKGISSSSEIHETSKIGKDCFVGSFSFIGKNCVIGDNVQIYPQSYISDNVHIGSNTIIKQGVKVLHNSVIGNFCVIHSGAIIGSDGFGFSPQNDGSFKKVPQTGNVIIKDFVDIGSNTTIDKATLGSTLIGKGVKLDNQIISPWRYVQIADNSSELLISNIILNLNDDPDPDEDYSWVKPGKYMGVWWEMIGTNQSTWFQSKFHAANNEKVMSYLDFASKHNFDGLLVEGWNKGWYSEWCCLGEGIPFSFTETFDDFDIDLLSDYGLKKGVRLIGHHETGGQIQNYENQMEEAFEMYNKYGIKNIKTGYVNDVSKNIKVYAEDGSISKEWHHGQYMINHFQKVIDIAAKYQLTIKTHEPIKDTGLRRKYPNFISREGAKGQEFNGFSSNGVNHATDLPFTRLLSGPMDYTPGIFQLNNFRYTNPGSGKIDKNAIVPSTIAKELALYVVYYSPMQMAADLPSHYKKHLEAFEFIKNVPVNWENKIIINSKISEYLTIARKDIYSHNWYIGGITDEKSRSLKLKLDFLDDDSNYSAKIYKDSEKTHWKNNPMEYEIETVNLNNKSEID